MKQFDDPMDFAEKLELEEFILRYKNLREISQGGPMLGELYLNGKRLFRDKECGGPSIIMQDILIVPVYIRSFFQAGFKLGMVNMRNKKQKVFGKMEDYIHLKKDDKGNVFYYSDRIKSKENIVSKNVLAEFDRYSKDL